MERIFAGEVYEIIPQPNGIVFAYCRESYGEHIIVGYKMISFDSGKMTDVAKNIYQLSKYGGNYRSIVAESGNFITTKSIVLPGGKVFAVKEDGKATLFDDEGVMAWTGEMNYRDEAPSDIAIFRSSLWASYANANVMVRFSLTTLREELRIGGKNSPFQQPADLFVSGENAFVSNVASNRLLKVNLCSYTVEEYKEFSEAVYGYVRVGIYEFVLLKSGIYVL